MDSIINNIVALLNTNSAPYLLILISFFAGVLASLSPCSLGILPLIVAYVGGSERKKQAVIFAQMLSFSFGLALIMSIIGVFCALTGKVFGSFTSPIFVLIIASLLLIFGLSMTNVIEINFPNFIKEMPQNRQNSLFLYPFLIGIIFAFTSSPCSTPILAAVMALATLTKNIYVSIAYLFSFALGQCVIIIICGLFANAIKNLRIMAKYSSALIKISGILLIICALTMMYFIFRPII